MFRFITSHFLPEAHAQAVTEGMIESDVPFSDFVRQSEADPWPKDVDDTQLLTQAHRDVKHVIAGDEVGRSVIDRYFGKER
ncbi:hypothetical protein IPM62_00595 [Candidatus Woesebacteria bacterium]|nr:MAG: hypothetical protein IPM62_00595 [Candidatus Woesebacteria bacterium]